MRKALSLANAQPRTSFTQPRLRAVGQGIDDFQQLGSAQGDTDSVEIRSGIPNGYVCNDRVV